MIKVSKNIISTLYDGSQNPYCLLDKALIIRYHNTFFSAFFTQFFKAEVQDGTSFMNDLQDEFKAFWASQFQKLKKKREINVKFTQEDKITILIKIKTLIINDQTYFSISISYKENGYQQKRKSEKKEKWYQLAFELFNQGVYEYNFQTHEVILSGNFLSIFGYDAKDKFSSLDQIFKYLHPDDYSELAKIISNYHTNKHLTHESELRLRCKDGRYKWIKDKGKIVEFDAAGFPVRLIGAYIDIDQEKRLQNAMEILVTSTSRLTGMDFFRTFTKLLAEIFEFEEAGIALKTSANNNKMKVLTHWAIDGLTENIEYDFEGTPSEVLLVMHQNLLIEDLQKNYPNNQLFKNRKLNSMWAEPLIDNLGKAIGMIYLLSSKIINPQNWSEQILKVFAPRINSEIVKIDTENALIDNEKKFKKIFESLPISLIEIDASKPLQILLEERQKHNFTLAAYLHQHPFSLKELLKINQVITFNSEITNLFKIDTKKKLHLFLFRLLSKDNYKIFRQLIETLLNGIEAFEIEIEWEIQGLLKNLLFKFSAPTAISMRGDIIISVIDVTESKRNERTYDIERRQFLSLFDSLNAFVYVVDITTNIILFANKPLINEFATNIIGMNSQSTLHSLGYPIGIEHDILIVSDQHFVQFEYHNNVLNRDFMVIDKIIKWPDGRDVKFEFAVDITERKVAEVALQKRMRYDRELAYCSQILMEGKNNALQKTLEHLLIATECDFITIYENFYDNENELFMRKAYWAPFGIDTLFSQPNSPTIYKYADGLERWENIFWKGNYLTAHLDELPQKEINFLEIQETKSILVIPIKVNTKWWGIITLNSKAQNHIFDKEHIQLLRNATEFIGVTIEKSKYEEKLSRSTDKYQKLLEHTSDFISEINSDGIYTFVSHSFAKLLEINNANYLIGKSSFNRIHPDQVEFIIQQYHKSQETLESVKSTYQFLKSNDEWIWLESVANFYKSNDGQTNAVIISRDVTIQLALSKELISAKESSEEANRAKSEFLANMSHEIRTPMNAILGFSEILREKLGNEEQYNEYIRGINTSGKNLLNLINDILDLSKIEARRMEIRQEPFNIRGLMEEIKQIFKIKAEEQNLSFSVNISENVPQVFILDETRLRQVLFNLVGNALKFTTKGGITLNVRIAQNLIGTGVELIIEVVDTGMGIIESQQNLIFEPFRQQKGQDIRFGGTGLGLAISKRLIEMMNGQILLESQKDKGSRFTIQIHDIQVSDSILDALPEAFQNIENIQFGKTVILLAEDLDVSREIVKAFLMGHPSITIIEAQNGQEAVDLAKKIKPDLILMDIQMPVLDGIRATQKIKKDPDLVKIPIIALSANAMQNQIDSIMQNCDNYLRKPVSKNELISMLIKYLKPIVKIIENKTNVAPASMLDALRNQNTLNASNSEVLQEFFSNELKPIYEELSKKLVMPKIKAFAESIVRKGVECNIDILINYGGELLNYSNNFNTTQIQKMLGYFPEFIKVFEKKIILE